MHNATKQHTESQAALDQCDLFQSQQCFIHFKIAAMPIPGIIHRRSLVLRTGLLIFLLIFLLAYNKKIATDFHACETHSVHNEGAIENILNETLGVSIASAAFSIIDC